jgi:hypothetical protein
MAMPNKRWPMLTPPTTPEQKLLCAVFGVEYMEELDEAVLQWHEEMLADDAEKKGDTG